MVMPRSRSMSMESSTCSLPAISRSVSPPVIWIRRSASVDLPWSIWATMEKLRMLEMGAVVMGGGIASTPCSGNHYGPSSKAFLHAKLIPQLRKNRYAGAMSTASLSPAAARARSKLSFRRLAAWVYARAVDPTGGVWFVIGFAAVHAALWTLILINLKAAQDVHMDVAEAFAWGQKFQFGYGKHPPLSGWVAGLWFKLFPVKDWSTYALAMAVLSCGLVISWYTALRVVDRRRAFFVVVMLALYPIFNFKGLDRKS